MNTTRRQVLRGFSLGASSVLLSPLLQRLDAESTDSYRPLRFVFVVEGNGFNPQQAQPKSIPRQKDAKSRVTASDAAEELLKR